MSSAPRRKQVANDDFVKSLSEEIRRRDLGHALKSTNDAVARGRQDTLKVLNELVNLFFLNRWSPTLKYCDCVAQCVQDALEFSLQRSLHAKIKCHKAASLLCVAIMFNKEEREDDFVIYNQDTLMSRLHKHLVCLELVNRSRLVQKYMGCFIDEHTTLVFSALHVALKRGDRRLVNMYVQYISGMSSENDGVEQSREDNRCASIKDDFGLFEDVKECDKQDPCWMLWYFIILYNKSRGLKERRRDYWLYIDELVARNLVVFKIMYNKRDRDERMTVLLRLYNMVASITKSDKRRAQISQDEGTDFDLTELESKVTDFLKTYEIPSGGLLMKQQEASVRFAKQQHRQVHSNVKLQTQQTSHVNEPTVPQDEYQDDQDVSHGDEITYFDDGCDDYKVEYRDTHIVRRLNDKKLAPKASKSKQQQQQRRTKETSKMPEEKPMDYLMYLTRVSKHSVNE